MKLNGELACRELSEKALKLYNDTDLFKVYEYENKNGKKLYAYTGCLGDSEDLTFEELQDNLETLADELEEE